jgi:integrase
MASITNEPNGRRTVQVVGLDGRRRSIRLGKVSIRQAEVVRARVEELLAARRTGQAHSIELRAWLDRIDDELHARLAAAELVPSRPRTTLGAFIDQYIAGRTDTKQATRTVYQRARRHLVSHFGEDRSIRSISIGDADAFRIALDTSGLSVATARRTIGVAKQFFRAACRSGLIETSPFADLVSAVPANPDRAFFVTIETTQKLLTTSDDPEWRLLIALARFGGLRVPSEPLRLTWGAIDFDAGRLRVESPKTEHHAGKAARLVPLFPELRPHLLAVRGHGQNPDDPVITRYRISTANLRSELHRRLKRIGIEPWPKPWQNMRASRETELVERFPAHVVAAWLGHSPAVANKHYLQVTDDHFTKAVQNPVQSPAAPGRIDSRAIFDDRCNLPLFKMLRENAR